jgi:hypothetical protein
MRLTLIAFCLMCATAGFGQTASVLTNDPQPVTMTDHPGHASHHELATPQSILDESSYSYEKGERPISEFATPGPQPTALGDIARAYRKEHASVPKAEFIFEKYEAQK